MSQNPEWTIENFLEVRDGGLHIDGVAATTLAKKYGTPLFVFSESRITSNIARLTAVQSAIKCPLKICYAAKAMSTMAVLRVIKDADIDIEVNSGGELWKALEIGFRPDQIIFNGTSKEVWEIENAIKSGIYALQVDSLYELSLIEKIAKKLRRQANVSLRLVPEIETDTHSGLQTALLTSKFGMLPDEAFEAFRKYKDSPHLDMCGIHLHIGSQNPDPSVYTEAFEKLFICLSCIYSETGKPLKHINLGGGFPVNYLRDRSVESEIDKAQRPMFQAGFEPVAAIASAWDDVRKIADVAGTVDMLESTTLLLEPGRSIIADAGICLTTVRNEKIRPVPPSKQEPIGRDTWLLTDAGFNNLLSMETYKWYYQLISATRAGEKHDFPYKLAGPLCDGGDVYFDIEGQHRLPDHRLLPSGVEPDEVLAFLNCGAYSLAQESQYNGRFRPPVVLIRKSGKIELIRKRDDFDDLVATDVY